MPNLRSIALWGMTGFAVLVAGGCATVSGQPEIKNAYIMPGDLQPGETAVITVEIEDKFDIVERVEGVVKEDRTITFKFQDNGVPPDETAGDDIWTIQVDVPFNAPPGEFEFEVTAYDAEGEVIVVDDEAGEAAPLATSFSLEIHYPEESETPSE